MNYFSRFLGEISGQDVEITGGNDEHYIPGNPGIFISWIKPGSDADKVLRPGCQITKVRQEAGKVIIWFG